MLGSETICIAFYNVANLHLTFLSDRFKCLDAFNKIFIFPQLFNTSSTSCLETCSNADRRPTVYS